MLRVVVADGLVHPSEKAMLAEFASANAISKEAHRDALAKCGWKVEEYEQGVKSEVMLLRQNSSADYTDADEKQVETPRGSRTGKS